MFDYSKATFSDKEKIIILFKEYDTLRTEAISRSGAGYQIVAVFAGLFAAILAWGATHPPPLAFWTAIGVVAGVGVGSVFVIFRDIFSIARRIAEIEKHINHLAGGDTLLVWESRLGSAASGVVRRRGGT